MNADPLKLLHERQIQDQAQPVTLYGPGGGNNPPTVQLSGSKAVGESDQTGTGNGTAEFTASVRFVDVYNGGTGVLTITAGGVTRNVPPGPRLCEFPTASDTFTIVADGPWVATANA